MMFHPRAEPAPAAPHEALGRAIPIGSECVVTADGRRIVGTYAGKRVFAEATAHRVLAVLRVDGVEHSIDVETITRVAGAESVAKGEPGGSADRTPPNARSIEYRGRLYSIRALARELGVPHQTFGDRLRRYDFDVERAAAAYRPRPRARKTTA